MTVRRTHIVGAGVAGLSAALAVTADGGAAVVYEAAPQPGGRCRTLQPADGFIHDNGTHVLFTANGRTLDLLEVIGARDRWFEPEPKGLPLYDGRTGEIQRVGLSPWSWLFPSRRPHGLTLPDLARILRLVFTAKDCPVASIIGDRPIMDSLIEPLTVAVLNTPPAQASSQRLACALRRLIRPGAGRLLVARNGLSEDLIEPAVATLTARGAAVHTGQRLRRLLTSQERVIGLALPDRTVMLGPEDRVILALPPYEVGRLLPALPVPTSFEPILNVHYRMKGLASPRFIGFSGTLAQWALVRPSHVSVTVSAADAVMDHHVDDVAARIWSDIAPALRRLGLDAETGRQPESRVVKEKRATIRQAAEELPQPPLRPLTNLALAGDWIGSLPATIESAVMAGEHAASLLRHVRCSRQTAPRDRPLKTENAA
ncbi:hydroxysqualene dehydroxylase [Microvirga lotononidis]|uniref:Protoporphyrinogen oxidase n=1 Tax=Microvirga lotononidis TaxID=864069 RepID=I4YME6_9HYPH|nr:FAD-dependent oxidoreductase [Microvirga lotononidis]EIM25138.1 protoporphyrinogen oxidase [Microvirga lotononidis]WQO29374.1 FAD-dependent oxidoreductase [Microvirga lotononidis]